MPYKTDIIINDIFTRTPSYIGGVIDVSAYTELTLDIALNLCLNIVVVDIYRINPNGVPELLRELTYNHNQKIALDLYRFDLSDGATPNNLVSAFGNKIQIQMSADNLMSGVISMKGKGLL